MYSSGLFALFWSFSVVACLSVQPCGRYLYYRLFLSVNYLFPGEHLAQKFDIQKICLVLSIYHYLIFCFRVTTMRPIFVLHTETFTLSPYILMKYMLRITCVFCDGYEPSLWKYAKWSFLCLPWEYTRLCCCKRLIYRSLIVHHN